MAEKLRCFQGPPGSSINERKRPVETPGNEGDCDQLFKDLHIQPKNNYCFGQTKGACWIKRSIG